MKRRNFLTWMGVSGLATSLPLAIAACAPSETDADSAVGTEENAANSDATEAPEETAVASNAAAITVGTLADLDAQGSLVIEDPDKVIVIRDPNNADGVIALTANCNHQNCTVGWDAENSQFVCPCHQSKFAIDGTLEQGPATQPLQVLAASVDGDTVQVSL
jgi:cytochrome b6-f complex iron-sulfur subunit